MHPLFRRTTCAVAALSVAAVISPVASAHAAGTTSSPAWVATLTRPVAYAGRVLGAVDPQQPVHVTVALRQRDAAAMRERLRAIYTPGDAGFHHFLTPQQWRRDYAPTTASLRAVTDYLRANGFRGISATGNRMAVQATAPAARVEKAFATRLVDFQHGHDVVFGNTTVAKVPAALGSIVSSVIGLNDLPVDLVKPLDSSPSTGGLYPAQFATTYDAAKTKSGAKTSIAVLTEGAFKPVLSSLRYAEAKEHGAKVPVTLVKVGPQSQDAAGADEFDMDTQASTLVAGGVQHLYAYNIGALLDSEIVADFATFVSQDKASALSASIGGCEYNSYLDGSELFNDVTMQQGAMQGQSIFASSGDTGDACAFLLNTGAPTGVPQVEWPASGTFDVSVGGTSLISDADGNRSQEIAWLGGGGGLSELENPGWWTQDTNIGQDAEYVTGGRAVPDVALDADPNLATPANVYVGKKVLGVGGTSLSSPLMLGLWARLESAHHNKLGLASIALYGVYDKADPGVTQDAPVVGLPVTVPTPPTSAVPGFTDIELGTNGLYQAGPGYDLASGLGAPDVAQLVKALR